MQVFIVQEMGTLLIMMLTRKLVQRCSDIKMLLSNKTFVNIRSHDNNMIL